MVSFFLSKACVGFEKWDTAVLGHFELHPDQASVVAALAHPPAVRVGFHVKGRPPFPVDAPCDRLLALTAALGCHVSPSRRPAIYRRVVIDRRLPMLDCRRNQSARWGR